MELHLHSNGEKKQFDQILEDIIANAKSHFNHSVPNASDLNLSTATSDSVLTEAKSLKIISESTYSSILSVQREEIKHFQHNREVISDYRPTHEFESGTVSSSLELQPGQICNYMNRFIVTWELNRETARNMYFQEYPNAHCKSCVVGEVKVAEVRHMLESDWLYLAKLSKGLVSRNFQQDRALLDGKTKENMENTGSCLDYAKLSAQRALVYLKSIPVAARRSLPVLVSKHNQLLSIPVRLRLLSVLSFGSLVFFGLLP